MSRIYRLRSLSAAMPHRSTDRAMAPMKCSKLVLRRAAPKGRKYWPDRPYPRELMQVSNETRMNKLLSQVVLGVCGTTGKLQEYIAELEEKAKRYKSLHEGREDYVNSMHAVVKKHSQMLENLRAKYDRCATKYGIVRTKYDELRDECEGMLKLLESGREGGAQYVALKIVHEYMRSIMKKINEGQDRVRHGDPGS